MRKILTISLIFLMLSSLFLVILPVDNVKADNPAWFDMSWTYRKLITINHSQVDENLVNFPILINLTDTDLRDYAQSDGDDIMFISYDGSIQYNHEIEKYSSASGKLFAWVNVTSISSSSDTLLWMYYNNSGASNQEHVTDTWDSNYMAVYHMDYVSSKIQDSTVNDRDASRSGNTATTSDKFFGDCQLFTGDWSGSSSTHITTDDAFFDTGDSSVTWSAWLYNKGITYDYGGWFEPLSGNNGYAWYCLVHGAYSFGVWGGGSVSAGYGQKQWRYLTYTRNGETNSAYSNGTLQDTNTNSVNDDCSGLTKIRMGPYATSGNPPYWMNTYGGWIEELRISSVIRSDGWIQTEYNSMENGSVIGEFFTLGSQAIYVAPLNLPPSFSNETPTDGAIDVPLGDIVLYIDINDTDGFNYNWGCSDGSHNSAMGNSNGTKLLMLDNSFPEFDCGTLYTWWVNATDGGNYTNESYSFTTIPCSISFLDVFVPVNNSELCPCFSSLCFTISSDSDTLNYTIFLNNGSGFYPYDSQSNVSSGQYCLCLCGLRFNHSYQWYVNTSVYGVATYNQSDTFTFSTMENINSCYADVLPDSMEISFDIAQLGMILSLILFIFFLWIGYHYEKRSAGAFILMAGLILLGIVAGIYTYMLSISMILVPLAIFICLLGINKWLIKPNMAEDDEDKQKQKA